jgi:hypothetical protein
MKLSGMNVFNKLYNPCCLVPRPEAGHAATAHTEGTVATRCTHFITRSHAFRLPNGDNPILTCNKNVGLASAIAVTTRPPL